MEKFLSIWFLNVILLFKMMEKIIFVKKRRNGGFLRKVFCIENLQFGKKLLEGGLDGFYLEIKRELFFCMVQFEQISYYVCCVVVFVVEDILC